MDFAGTIDQPYYALIFLIGGAVAGVIWVITSKIKIQPVSDALGVLTANCIFLAVAWHFTDGQYHAYYIIAFVTGIILCVRLWTKISGLVLGSKSSKRP